VLLWPGITHSVSASLGPRAVQHHLGFRNVMTSRALVCVPLPWLLRNKRGFRRQLSHESCALITGRNSAERIWLRPKPMRNGPVPRREIHSVFTIWTVGGRAHMICACPDSRPLTRVKCQDIFITIADLLALSGQVGD
jgi:hypothetical protein